MLTFRALFFKTSCSINTVFLWDLPCQRRNHQGVRSMVVLSLNPSSQWCTNDFVLLVPFQGRKLKQVSLRLGWQEGWPAHARCFICKTNKALRCLKMKKYVSHKCMRAALPAVILFKGIWLRAIVHDKVPHTDTLVLPVFLVYISMGAVLSVLSRMCSCALLGCSDARHASHSGKEGREIPEWIILHHCWGPSIALWVPMQLHCLCIYT